MTAEGADGGERSRGGAGHEAARGWCLPAVGRPAVPPYKRASESAASGLPVRLGLILSAICHVLLLGFVAFASPRPLEAVPMQLITVDLVSPKDIPPPSIATAPKPVGEPPARPNLIEAPRLADTPLAQSEDAPAPQAPPPQRQTRSAVQQAAPIIELPKGADDLKGEKVHLPASGPQGVAEAQDQLAAAKVDPDPRAEPIPPPADQTQTGAEPLPPPAGATATPPQPEPAQSKPDPAAAAAGWFAALSELPVIIPTKPPEDAADRSRNDAEMVKEHLKKCWTLPAGRTADQRIRVVLRVFLGPTGALTKEPLLLAATAASAGPPLVRSAIRALHQCQPYNFLPAEKYKDWKVLDLSFSPQDTAG